MRPLGTLITRLFMCGVGATLVAGCSEIFHSYEYNRIQRYAAEAEDNANAAKFANSEIAAVNEQLAQTNQKLAAAVSTLLTEKH